MAGLVSLSSPDLSVCCYQSHFSSRPIGFIFRTIPKPPGRRYRQRPLYTESITTYIYIYINIYGKLEIEAYIIHVHVHLHVVFSIVLSEPRFSFLQEFARGYRMAGEKVVAADMVSRLNDKFYGQWLMLHVPFTDPAWFFENPEVRDKLQLIPEEHKFFAMAVLCPHPVAQAVWQSRGQVEEEMKMEAHTRAFRRTLLGMLDANLALVDKYLGKEANAEQEAAEREAQLAAAVPADEDELNLNAKQKLLKSNVDAAVDRAVAVQTAGLEDDVEDMMNEAYKEGKIYVCTGGPGTGKTTVALACVHRALQAGGKVLFVYPTNRQASRMRAKLPKDVDVDTYHAGFGLDEEPGAVAVSLSQYALIVVDEISQMQGRHFDHVQKLWTQADNMPVILMAGDEMQIAGYGEQRAWQHPSWKRTTFRVKLHQVYRCKDKKFNKVLQELRTSRPKKETLKWLKKRKA